MAGYGDDTKFTAWLAEQGYALPAGAAAPAVLRQRGSAYLDGTYEARLSGVRVLGLGQERAFPRIGAEAYCQAIPSGAVPVQWEHASYFAAYQEAIKPGSLSVGVARSGALKRKKIEGLEREFFEGSGDVVADATLRLSAIEGLVAPFLTPPSIALLVV